MKRDHLDLEWQFSSAAMSSAQAVVSSRYGIASCGVRLPPFFLGFYYAGSNALMSADGSW